MRLKNKIIFNLAVLLISIACLFIASSDCFAAWSDVSIWLDGGMKKYRQGGEDGTSGSNALTIKCAKNEFEPFQILVYNNHASDTITGVDVTVTEGTGTITDIYIYKELYIPVTTVSRPDYSTGYYPDPLIPKVDRYYGETRNVFPFDVAAKKVQGVWVDIGTTSATPAGTYTFNISVTKSGETSKTATVTLTVWNFTLPSTATLKSFMGIGDGDLHYGHYGSTTPPGGYDAWLMTMLPIYHNALLYHRLSPHTQNNGYNFTNVDSTGSVTSGSGWTAWDNYYSQFLDGTAISSGPLSGAKFSAVTVERANVGYAALTSDRDSSQSNAVTYFQDWWDHFTAKSWSPRTKLYAYLIDEPHGTSYTYWGNCDGSGNCTDYQVNLIKAKNMNRVTTGGADWTNSFVTAGDWAQLKTPGGSYTSLDTSGIYCPVTCLYTYRTPWQTVDQKYARTDYANYPNFTNRDHFGYLANQGSHGSTAYSNNAPDLMLETPPVLTRGYFWLGWFYRIHGFLLSGMVGGASHFYQHTPYADLMSIFGGNGDEMFFFPGVPTKTGRTGLPASTPEIGGTHDIPIESIRLKLIRKGIEDREYMELLMSASGVTSVDNQVNNLFSSLTDPGPYFDIKTTADLLTARENIANVLLGQDSSAPSGPRNLRIY